MSVAVRMVQVPLRYPWRPSDQPKPLLHRVSLKAILTKKMSGWGDVRSRWCDLSGRSRIRDDWLLTLFTIQMGTKIALSPFRREHPGAAGKGRAMSDMLSMTAS